MVPLTLSSPKEFVRTFVRSGQIIPVSPSAEEPRMNNQAKHQKLDKQSSYEIACQLHDLFQYLSINITKTFFTSIPAVSKGWNTKLFSTLIHNRHASTVDLTATDDAHDIDTNMSPAAITRAKFIKGGGVHW